MGTSDRLVCCCLCRNYDAVLIKVVATTGELEFTNTPGVDVFDSVVRISDIHLNQ